MSEFERRRLAALALICGCSELDVEPLAGDRFGSVFDVLLACLILGLTASAFADRRYIAGQFERSSMWLVLLFGAGFVFAPLSIAPMESAQRSVVAAALSFVVVDLVLRHGFERVLSAAVLGCVLTVGASIAGIVGGFAQGVNEVDNVIAGDTGFFGLPRNQGFTSQPNQLGRISALVAIGGLLLAGRTASLRLRRYGALAGTVGLVGLSLAQSRTAIGAFLVVAVVVLWKRGRKHLVVNLSCFAMALGLGAFAVGGLGLDSVVREGGGTNELTSATGRTDVWRVALELSESVPVLGVGAFATSEAFRPLYEAGQISFDAGDAHNLGLQVLLAQGAVGLSLLAAFTVSCTMGILRGRAAGGSGALLAVVLILSLTENIFWKPNTAVAFAALGGAACIRNEVMERTERRVRS